MCSWLGLLNRSSDREKGAQAKELLYITTSSWFPMESGICLVCSAPTTSTHLGMEVCRACSSFFKRAQLLNRSYPCRRGGEGQCDVAKDGNTTCRRCRYDKCVAVGLVYEGPLRPRRNPTEETPELDPHLNLPSTSTKESLLNRIGREYDISASKRQENELALLRKCSDVKRIPHPSFVELYHSYLPNYHMIESFFQTCKVWGRLDKYSLSLCVDLNAPETWLRSGDGIINRNAMIDSSISHIRDQMTVCLPSLNKAQLTDREVHALFALILCETDMRVDVSELLLSLLDSIRKEVLQDLQCYYREEMGLRDCSSRLGNLMTVCHAVRECTSHFYAFLRMQVTLFDLWSAETQLKELFL